MIYEPYRVFDLRPALTEGVQAATFLGAAEFLAGVNKPWSYYAGVGVGTTAAATGVVGAAATIYVVGDLLDFYILKSENGSDIRFFLNGVAHSSLDTYVAASTWESIQIPLQNYVINRVDIVNHAASTHQDASGVAWLALGPISVSGSNSYAKETKMAYDTVVFRIKDSEADGKLASVPVYIPSGKTVPEIQTWVTAFAPLLDAVTGGVVSEVTLSVSMTLPGGLDAAPDTGILNERGGLISFDTTGPHRDSIRIPAIKTTIMGGNGFTVLDGGDVEALVDYFNAANHTIQPVTRNEFQFTTPLAGKKSFRR